MKKKYLLLASLALMIMPVSVNAAEPENTYTVDGITITANDYQIKEYTAADESYDRLISFDFTVKNETDYPFGYTTAWYGKTQDGQDLEVFFDFFNIETKNVQPGEELEATASLMVPKGVEVDGDIVATYEFMDYNDEYWNDFIGVMMGEIGQNEWESKYSDSQEMVFSLCLSNESSEEETEDFSYTAEGHTYTYKGNTTRGNELLIYFEYTNNSGQTTQPSDGLIVSAFQGGIELERMYPGYENVTEQEELTYTNIQNGTTVEIAYIYELRDETNVSLEIQPHWTTNSTEIGRYEFEISK